MIKLSIRFLNHENKFNYRIALEIGLIIGLIICTSAVITGLSNQFTTLIQSNTVGQKDYVISESGTALVDSKIPLEIFNQIEPTYINFKIPFYVEPYQLVNGVNKSLYFTYFSDLSNSKTDFNLIRGFMPINSSQFLIGQGLANSLGITGSFPQKYQIIIPNNSISNVTITGIFTDTGPWYFSLLGELSDIPIPQGLISFIKVQLKNKVNLPVFKDQLQSLATTYHFSNGFAISELNQTDVLANSFFISITDLFNILMLLLFILMSLKLIHSSVTILHRLRYEYLINKILGMSNVELQGIFWLNLVITGNIGVLFGVFIGIALPQLLMVIINPFFGSYLLVLLPKSSDIIITFVLSNLIFIICSFFTYQLKLEDFKG